jgi:hypothetical protein
MYKHGANISDCCERLSTVRVTLEPVAGEQRSETGRSTHHGSQRQHRGSTAAMGLGRDRLLQ